MLFFFVFLAGVFFFIIKYYSFVFCNCSVACELLLLPVLLSCCDFLFCSVLSGHSGPWEPSKCVSSPLFSSSFLRHLRNNVGCHWRAGRSSLVLSRSRCLHSRTFGVARNGSRKMPREEKRDVFRNPRSRTPPSQSRSGQVSCFGEFPDSHSFDPKFTSFYPFIRNSDFIVKKKKKSIKNFDKQTRLTDACGFQEFTYKSIFTIE